MEREPWSKGSRVRAAAVDVHREGRGVPCKHGVKVLAVVCSWRGARSSLPGEEQEWRVTHSPAQASLRAGHKCWAADFREEEDKVTYHPLPALHPFALCSSRQG